MPCRDKKHFRASTSSGRLVGMDSLRPDPARNSPTATDRTTTAASEISAGTAAVSPVTEFQTPESPAAEFPATVVPVLSGARIQLRTTTEDDRPTLDRIFRDPDVLTWWIDPDEAINDAVGSTNDDLRFVIEWRAEAEPVVVGFIQAAEENDRMYRHAGIDIAIESAWQGRGIGVEAIRVLATYLFHERGHHRLTIDPAAHNERAIRTYQKVGFRPVGVMRQYERGADGHFHDGLLMDLLADELT